MRPHLWKTKLTANDSEAKEQLGIIRLEYNSANNLEKIYRYIKNDSGGDLGSGDIVVWDLSSGNAYSITTVATADVAYGAGVCIGIISNGNFGWIQVGGINPEVKLDGTVTASGIAAGDAIGTVATAGKGGVTAAAGAKIGFSLDAVSTDTIGKVFLVGLI